MVDKMTCSIEKIQSLQIREEYKQGLAQFCQDPANEEACMEICNAPPEAIIEAFTQAETALQRGFQEGFPEELVQGLSQRFPEANQLPVMQSQPAQGFAEGGLASLGRYKDDQIAHVETGEMVVPRTILEDNPQLKRGIATALRNDGVDPARFIVGGIGSYNPQTGLQEFGFFSDLWKGVKNTVKKIAPIALSIAAPTIGAAAMGTTAAALTAGQTALFTGLGTAAGSLVGGASLSDALKAGVMGGALQYGIGALSKGLSGPSAYTAKADSYTSGGELVLKGETVSPAMAKDIAEASASNIDAMFEPFKAPKGTIQTDTRSQQNPQELMKAGGGSLQDKAKGAWDWATTPLYGGESEVAKALSTPLALGAGALAVGSGILDAPQPKRPEGYSLSDPREQYGYYPYERMGREELFAGLGNESQGGAFNPIGANSDITGRGGYSFGRQTSRKPPPSSYWESLQASMAPFGATPYTALANGGHVNGPGTETSDSIPARLSDGEFVMTAQAVRGAGKGSVQEGARKMYQLMDELERRV